MAVLSTLQNIPTEVDTVTTYLHQSAGSWSPLTNGASIVTEHGMYNMPTASVTDLTHDSFFTTPTATTDFMASTFSGSLIDNHMDHQHGSAPVDGNTVWYCSNCSNGPMGTWYSACTECGHGLCGACTVEKAP